MIHSFPDYYKEFACIADKCEATCCAGWQIVVEEEALKRYRKVSGAFSDRIEKGVDFKEGVFYQDDNKRCAFLNEQNLCDMYTTLGEQSLCETCNRYPRHIEEFENVREFTLSVSCPEVARILLSKKEPVQFYDVEVAAEEEEFEDFNPMLYDRLVAARTELLTLLQDRTLSIAHRAMLVWRFAEEFQDTMDEGMLLTDEAMQEHRKDVCWREELLAELIKWQQDEQRSYSEKGALFGLLWKLEFLAEDWEAMLCLAEKHLYKKTALEYTSIQREFEQYKKIQFPDWDSMLEQLMVYFVYTYFCGSVYDDYVASKVKLAVVSAFYIQELLTALWLQQGKQLTRQDVERMVYRYSRELEHSDKNLCAMDGMLEEF